MQKENNKINTVKLLLSLVIIMLIGYVSFGYFLPRVISGTLFSTGGTGNASTPDITLLNSNSGLTLTGKYPMTEDVALNVVTPYTFQVRNNSSNRYANIEIVIESKTGNQITNDALIDVKINSGTKVRLNTPITAVTEGYSNGYLILSDTLSPKETKTYDLRLWINENANNIADDPNNVENKSWNGKIIVRAVSGIKTNEVYLANEVGYSALTGTDNLQDSIDELFEVIEGYTGE